MSLLGKIQALFADKERTQAIFPLTKVKAISDDDGTGLDAILDRAVYTDDGVIETSVASRDADTLGGLPAATYATTSFVKNEILNSQVGGDAGEIDLSGLATKDELSSKVDKAGDTMTGDLTINSGDWPSIFLKATGATNAGYLEGSKNSSGSLSLWSQNTADNNATRRGLRLVNSEGNSSIANALILSDLAEGVARKDYKIYGEHNKPTAADVGALPINGGTLTGNLTLTAGKKIQLSNASGHTSAGIGVDNSTGDVYISNINNNWLRIKGDKTMTIGGSKVYTALDKPTPADIGAAASSHGNHVPATQTANNATFLRNDNSWQKVTPANIGAAASSHNHAAGNITSGTLSLARGGTGSSGASVSSASNSYHTAYFSKFGNLVICSILPKSADSPQYDASITIPSGYVPKSNRIFEFYSQTNKNAGGTGIVKITANTGGGLYFQQAYGFSIHDIKYTLSWTV